MTRYIKEYKKHKESWLSGNLRRDAWFFYFSQRQDSDREIMAACINDAAMERKKIPANNPLDFWNNDWRELYIENTKQELEFARKARARNTVLLP